MPRLTPRLAGAVLLALLALAASAAPAQAAPGWWRVSDGHAEVWILGAPRIAPKTFAWDTASVTRRLTGASQLIIGVQPKGALKAMAGLITGAHSPTPLETSLTPALWRRFSALATAAGKDPKHYSNWKPAIAGLFLSGDVYKAAGLKGGDVEATVRKLAHGAGVREVPAGDYDTGEMANAALALAPAGQATCLAATLQGLETGTQAMPAIAAAWAHGEPRILPQTPADLACQAAMPIMKSSNERTIATEASAVAGALKTPGRSLAVFDLQSLMLPGGVLDHLRAKGLTVTGPVP